MELWRAFLKRMGAGYTGDLATLVLRSLIVIAPLLLLFFAGLIGFALAPEEEPAPEPVPVEVTVRESANQVLQIAPEEPLPGSGNTPRGESPAEIPGLSPLDVLAQLDGVPSGRSYDCPGSSASRGSLVWRCTSNPPGGEGAAYEVTAVGDNPGSTSTLSATATNATEEEAAEYLAYVASLALRGTGAADPTAWIEENLDSGGRLDAGGAEVSLYGTGEVRTVAVVGTRVSTQEPQIEVPLPKAIEEEDKAGASGKANSKEADTPGKAKADSKEDRPKSDDN